MSANNDILITGASGFLGKVINNYFRSNLNYQTVTIGRNGSVDIIYDIADTNATIDLPEGINIVVHAAGKAHSVPKTEKEIQEFIDVNFIGTKNLCANFNKLITLPKYFVFISTVAVYGVDKGEMITESHPLNGNTPYAISKIKAEEYLTAWAISNNVTLTILRLPLVAGHDAPGNLGAMINGIKKGRYLSIGKADARKSVIWVDDVAKIISLIAPVGGTYNITDGRHPTFKELETVIANRLQKKNPLKVPAFLAAIFGLVGDVLGKRAPINTNKLRKITSTLTFDDQKLHNAVDWTPLSVVEKLSQTL